MKTYPTDMAAAHEAVLNYARADAPWGAAQAKTSPVDAVVAAFDFLKTQQNLGLEARRVLAGCAR